MPSNSTLPLHLALLALLTALATAVLLGACRSTVPLGSRPEASVPKIEESAPEGEVFKNTIRWSTASEVDNFGFDVYRSESEDGPFVRVNPEVIEGGGTSDEPRHYEFVDVTIDPYKTYFYYVESIAMSGTRERFTPVGKAPAKMGGDSEPPPESPPPEQKE